MVSLHKKPSRFLSSRDLLGNPPCRRYQAKLIGMPSKLQTTEVDLIINTEFVSLTVVVALFLFRIRGIYHIDYLRLNLTFEFALGWQDA